MARRREPFWIEIVSGSAALGWGLYVLAFSVPLEAMPVYDVLTEHVPDYAWYMVAIGLGAGQCGSALLEWRRTRQVIAFAMLLFWKVLAVSMLKSGTPSPASMIICALALGNIPTFWLLQTRWRPRPVF